MVYMFLKRYVVGPVVNAVYRPRVVGLEHVPTEGPAILASNHHSVSDSIFMPVAVPRQVYFLAKSEYFYSPGIKGKVVGQFFRAINQIPMDRGGGRASAQALSTGGQALHEGKLLGIYPEGTRSPDGRLYRGKIGVARLALESGAPVIPIAMIGTDAIQPAGTKVPDPRKARVTTIFGEPMDFSHLKGKQSDHATLRQVTDQIMEAIQALSGQETADLYAAQYKRQLADERRENFKAQAKDVAAAAREKGREMSESVVEKVENLGAKLPSPKSQDTSGKNSDKTTE